MLLEILTRCYARPRMLAANRASLDRQTCGDWMQTFLHDRQGRGVHWANGNLGRYGPSLEGDYVWVLDDDDFCAYNRFVEDVAAIVASDKPDLIMLKCDVQGHGEIPEPDYWGKPPVFAHVAMSGFVATRALWQAHAGAFDCPQGADHAFASRAYADAGKVYWLDRVAMRTQRVSRGAPE